MKLPNHSFVYGGLYLKPRTLLKISDLVKVTSPRQTEVSLLQGVSVMMLSTKANMLVSIIWF